MLSHTKLSGNARRFKILMGMSLQEFNLLFAKVEKAHPGRRGRGSPRGPTDAQSGQGAGSRSTCATACCSSRSTTGRMPPRTWRPRSSGCPVEIDEVYIGGREKNKHVDKKGTTKKTAVVGIRDRKTNTVRAAPVPETTAVRLEHFVEKNAETGATAYTDDNAAYAGLANHESVNHSVGEYVRGQAHINGMESFWALLRRGYYGTFHHLSEKHLHRYVNEFAGRLNIRSMDTIGMMGSMAGGMAGRRLMYSTLIA